MPFRYFQVLRLLTLPLFVLAALNFVPARYDLARKIGVGAVLIVAGLAALGVLLALVFLFTGPRFPCPFCRRWGSGAFDAKGLPWMECDGCGTIRCAGLLGLRVERET